MGIVHLAANDAAKIKYGFLIDFDNRPNIFFVCYLFSDSFPDYPVIFSIHCPCHHNIDVHGDQFILLFFIIKKANSMPNVLQFVTG